MTFEPGDDMTNEEVKTRVTEAIENDNVILFMKGTELMPQCGYSKTALQLLQQHTNEDITIINVLEGPTDVYREVLEERTGWQTIPQAFVDGEFLGGADVLEQLEENGELREKLGMDPQIDDPSTGPF